MSANRHALSCATLDWDDVAWMFEVDGSHRDIYVLGTSRRHWKAMWQALSNAGLQLDLTVAGDPRDATLLFDQGFFPGHGSLLRASSENLQFWCHFFAEETIEFDFYPGSVTGQTELTSLVAFMALIASATVLEVRLTGENCPGFPLVVVSRETLSITLRD